MIAQIFKTLVIETALRTYKIIRQHPLMVALLILFFVILPWLAEKYLKAAALFRLVRRVVAFFKGLDKDGNEITDTATKVLRYVLLVILWILIPFSSVIFGLFSLSHWIGREKTINAEGNRSLIEPARG